MIGHAQHFTQPFRRIGALQIWIVSGKGRAPSYGNHFHPQRAREASGLASDFAITHYAQRLAANLHNIELFPLTGILTAYQPAQILDEKQNRRDAELSQRILEDASTVG